MGDFTEVHSKIITVNTDASFHPESKASGFAYYIRYGGTRYSLAARFNKLKPKDPTQAEIYAIGNAIASLIKRNDISPAKFIIINTDCKWAIRQITMKSSNAGKKVAKLVNKLMEKSKCKDIRFKFVKSHNENIDSRTYINNWCDSMAKEQMRIAHREYQDKINLTIKQ